MSVQVSDKWFESPLVKYAASRAGDFDGYTPLELLEALNGIMLDLEERAPGIPFVELLGTRSTGSTPRGRAAAAALLKEKGFEDTEITALLETGRFVAPPESKKKKPPHAAIAGLVGTGLTAPKIAEKLGITPWVVYRSLRKQGITIPDGRNK